MDKDITNKIQGSFWLKSLKKMVQGIAWYNNKYIFDDDGKQKYGISDWINIEVLVSLLDSMQNFTNLQFKMLKNQLKFTRRLNPKLKEKIELDKFTEIDKMEDAVKDFFDHH